MSDAERCVFPMMDAPVELPAWTHSHAGADVQPLLDRLRDGATRARGGDVPPPSAAQVLPPAPQDTPDQRPISRLPPPPSLGTLLPGGRSNPPPANDLEHETLDERTRAFADAAIELAVARAATLAVLEGQLLDLAIEVAAAVIEREVERAPELHTTLVRAALLTLGDATRVTLRTSPTGFTAIVPVLGGETIEAHGVQVHIVADPTVPGLGCVIDGEYVRVDATVTERLRAVRRAFEDERRRCVESAE